MRGRIVAAFAVLAVVGLALPAAAAVIGKGTPIPEPSDFALFLLGVTGLVVGRWSSRKRRGNDDTNA